MQYEHEQREYQQRRQDAMDIRGIVFWVVWFACLLVVIVLAGCGCPGDSLRVTNPVTWTELETTQLHERCMSWDEKTRGCVISGPEGDAIYVLPVERHGR